MICAVCASFGLCQNVFSDDVKKEFDVENNNIEELPNDGVDDSGNADNENSSFAIIEP